MPNPRLPSSHLLPRVLPALALLCCAAIPVAHARADATADADAKQTVATTPARSMQEIIDASQPSDWRTPDPDNLLYMDLEAGRVVIELAPGFAPEHVANIQTLAREGFWDGLSIYRSHDNFVVQFGDPDAGSDDARSIGSAKAHLPAEFERSSEGLDFQRLPDQDGYAPQVGFVDGFPVGRNPDTGKTWLAHCYGAVGAGRGMAADSSIGAELYVVTGQSPRQLDRNITLVGRVLDGIELLSIIPRGPEPLGIYEDPARRTPILSIQLASEVPVTERMPLQVMRTDTPLFEELVESRRNRSGWYLVPAGHIDLCNVPIPVRTPPADTSEVAD